MSGALLLSRGALNDKEDSELLISRTEDRISRGGSFAKSAVECAFCLLYLPCAVVQRELRRFSRGEDFAARSLMDLSNS